jgi:hypothetical protein
LGEGAGGVAGHAFHAVVDRGRAVAEVGGHVQERRPPPIVSISGEMRPEIENWLAGSAAAWRKALAPLTDGERRRFVDTLLAYERGLEEPRP